jgi:hypothetical protein
MKSFGNAVLPVFAGIAAVAVVAFAPAASVDTQTHMKVDG